MGWAKNKKVGLNVSRSLEEKKAQEYFISSIQQLGAKSNTNGFKWNDNWWDNTYTDAIKKISSITRRKSTHTDNE